VVYSDIKATHSFTENIKPVIERQWATAGASIAVAAELVQLPMW
jgi:hypothetical protein